MNAFFEIVKYAFIVLLLLILAISYVYEEYLPRYPVYYFRRLLREFGEVLDGSVSYNYYRTHYEADCLELRPKDSRELREFKNILPVILQYEGFVRRTLSDSSITYYGFIEAWKLYDPDLEFVQSEILPEETSRSEDSSVDNIPINDHSKEIAKILSLDKGKEMMEKLVSLGYCEPVTYRWKEKHSSYLMALFAYAIIQEHNNKRGIWVAFSRLWCSEKKNNLTTLRDQALESPNSKSYIETVQSVFPNYNPDKR